MALAAHVLVLNSNKILRSNPCQLQRLHPRCNLAWRTKDISKSVKNLFPSSIILDVVNKNVLQQLRKPGANLSDHPKQAASIGSQICAQSRRSQSLESLRQTARAWLPLGPTVSGGQSHKGACLHSWGPCCEKQTNSKVHTYMMWWHELNSFGN